MTKACKIDCEKGVDCEMSDWDSWSGCSSNNGQTYRTHQISKMPKYGGAVCAGSLEETRWCTAVKDPVDCVVGDWHAWMDCTAKCDGGTHSLEETRWCTAVKDPVDCVVGDWHAWMDCTAKCDG